MFLRVLLFRFHTNKLYRFSFSSNNPNMIYIPRHGVCWLLYPSLAVSGFFSFTFFAHLDCLSFIMDCQFSLSLSPLSLFPLFACFETRGGHNLYHIESIRCMSMSIPLSFFAVMISKRIGNGIFSFTSLSVVCVRGCCLHHRLYGMVDVCMCNT